MLTATPAERSPLPDAEALRDCPLCPRLVALRRECRVEFPDWWNAPVPAFGDRQAWLAIIGLAPGKHGANRTGRPFTGDYAGDLLYATLAKFGLSEGNYAADPGDGLRLRGAIILNAVKCLPPQNKTLPVEEANCRPFLMEAIASLPNLTTFIALGKVAHDSLCRSFGLSPARSKFAHGAVHQISDDLRLVDSYHCSRYNQNTRRLDAGMFESVFAEALAFRPATLD
ncbi:uracil-DNA glycosylase [Sphingomonas rhizophila]|uniref:Type-5 uracil-DNA glycosylase n=1 Tax=Sphingomonas rhizophila TaxID=2071607 RepID=A0A7G9SE02_9SPHN|nr:uracil-DNA glycosylase [Sphingomonas rhizophila]QNN66077.1 uracil-DNA glycosylase [Sphingomonas rhizophila]